MAGGDHSRAAVGGGRGAAAAEADSGGVVQHELGKNQHWGVAQAIGAKSGDAAGCDGGRRRRRAGNDGDQAGESCRRG